YIPKHLNFASLDIIRVQSEFVTKVKAAARWRPPYRTCKPRPVPPAARNPPAVPGAPTIVAIGTSTGGPRALQEILPILPSGLPVAILVVQHMPPGFTAPFERRLNDMCQMPVVEAHEGMRAEPGRVYMAAAGRHMTVSRSNSTIVLHAPATPSEVM